MARRKKKKDQNWKIFMILMMVLIGVCMIYGLFEWWKARKSMFIRYEAFGISIPKNYLIHGIDVSKYQQYIDWTSVGKMTIDDVKIGFAFIKATEGVSRKDLFFNRNWKFSKRCGIKRGAYHFFLANKSGLEQADNFISQVTLESGDLPPVLDIEQTMGVSNVKLQARLKEFLLRLENYYGVQPIIYTNVQFYKHHLEDQFEDYPLWVAHYLELEKPRISRDWHFWQHSESGHVNGIRSYVDFNVFYGDSSDFKNLLVP
jgi:lysozyme